MSSQLRSAAAYVAMTSLMLIFLNIYSGNTIRKMIYRAKEATLQEKAQLIAASFSDSGGLNTESIGQVISVLGELNVSDVLVTDTEGETLYASAEELPPLPAQVLQTAEGKDVFYCSYTDGALESCAAAPVMTYDTPIGCVYVFDIDREQGGIISALEANTMRISLSVEVVLVLFSALFAIASSRKMRTILDSIQKTGKGEYSHKIEVHGTDEYAVIAKEFNQLSDRLEVSRQAQRQFVSDASHELKTPLASIKLLSDSILQNQMDTETVQEFVSDIGEEADRLTKLTQKLLAISKAENVEQTHEVVDLGQTINKVAKMLQPLAEERGIQFVCTGEKNATVLTVEDDMHQIIFNLAENAIKYNVDGGRVQIDLEKTPEDVVITVEDTGIGIPAEEAEHIFERFYRVDKARSREQGGAGLGLSIVHDLVKRNLGQITVAPGTESGTRFTVTFPRFDVE